MTIERHVIENEAGIVIVWKRGATIVSASRLAISIERGVSHEQSFVTGSTLSEASVCDPLVEVAVVQRARLAVGLPPFSEADERMLPRTRRTTPRPISGAARARQVKRRELRGTPRPATSVER